MRLAVGVATGVVLEHYRAETATISGDATYSNDRQFQTGARLITNP